MKKLSFIKMTAVITAAVVCSGCIPHTELNEKAIVLAVAVDYEDEKYKVTFQYYSPTGIGGQTPVDNSQPNVLTSSGEGENVYEAMEEASFKCGRKLMSGVIQIIIIGEEAAVNSVDKVTDFAESSFQSRPDMLIAISSGKAEELMKVKFNEGTVSTQKLRFLLNNAQANGLTVLPSALDYYITLETKQQSICLPVLKLIDDGKSDASEDGKTIEIDGGALIKNGRSLGMVSAEVTEGIQLLWGKTTDISVTVQREEEKVSIRLSKVKVKIEPIMEGDTLVFKVGASCRGEYLVAPPHHNNNDEMEQKCGEQLIKLMKTAAEETVLKCGADPINLEKTVRHHDYSLWKQIEDNWEETLINSRFEFDVKVEINRLSMED